MTDNTVMRDTTRLLELEAFDAGLVLVLALAEKDAAGSVIARTDLADALARVLTSAPREIQGPLAEAIINGLVAKRTQTIHRRLLLKALAGPAEETASVGAVMLAIVPHTPTAVLRLVQRRLAQSLQEEKPYERIMKDLILALNCWID